MPGRFELKPTLAKIWHAPDHFRIMDPLPPMHRRGIIAGAVLVIIGFLLPAADNSSAPPVSRNAQLDLQSQSQLQSSTPQAVPLPPHASTPPVNDPDQVAPVAPEPLQDEQPADQEQSQPVTQQPQRQSSAPGAEQQWRSYRVEPGKTMAQLFRDHNLPPTDVYSMSQVEGAGKPLSTLQAGQRVQIRQNANGVVTGLTIDTGNGQQVLFTRQTDGSFIRAR